MGGSFPVLTLSHPLQKISTCTLLRAMNAFISLNYGTPVHTCTFGLVLPHFRSRNYTSAPIGKGYQLNNSTSLNVNNCDILGVNVIVRCFLRYRYYQNQRLRSRHLVISLKKKRKKETTHSSHPFFVFSAYWPITFSHISFFN